MAEFRNIPEVIVVVGIASIALMLGAPQLFNTIVILLLIAGAILVIAGVAMFFQGQPGARKAILLGLGIAVSPVVGVLIGIVLGLMIFANLYKSA